MERTTNPSVVVPSAAAIAAAITAISSVSSASAASTGAATGAGAGAAAACICMASDGFVKRATVLESSLAFAKRTETVAAWVENRGMRAF